MVYVPVALVSTVPVATTVVVPLTASNAVAPSSLYTSPTKRLMVDDPFRVMTGGVISTTLIVRVVVAVFPEESVTEYVTEYVPTVFMFKDEESTEATNPTSRLSETVEPCSR